MHSTRTTVGTDGAGAATWSFDHRGPVGPDSTASRQPCGRPATVIADVDRQTGDKDLSNNAVSFIAGC